MNATERKQRREFRSACMTCINIFVTIRGTVGYWLMWKNRSGSIGEYTR